MPIQHRFGDAAVIDGRWIRGGQEILGVSARVTGDANQPRTLENCRPSHRGEVSLVGVLFCVVDKLDFHFSSPLPYRCYQR
jgi:hypothetical protein